MAIPIIGEILNAVIPKVGQVVIARDAQAISALARCQVKCGALTLDVNAGGLAGRGEVPRSPAPTGGRTRGLLNRTFVAMLIALGLEAFMVDVRDPALMATPRMAVALTGRDEWRSVYLKACRAGKLDGK